VVVVGGTYFVKNSRDASSKWPFIAWLVKEKSIKKIAVSISSPRN
jgi:hypothetical protein